MIYNTASIFLAGLISIASAASVQHAPKSHNALVATEHPTQLVKKINESSYSSECVEAWKIFDASRCWCFTGCGLDCSQGGEPGKPGTETNPELCQDLPPKENCLEPTCDLVGKCTGNDASVDVDGAAPGLDTIVETGSYDCAPKPAAAAICPAGLVQGECPVGYCQTTQNLKNFRPSGGPANLPLYYHQSFPSDANGMPDVLEYSHGNCDRLAQENANGQIENGCIGFEAGLDDFGGAYQAYFYYELDESAGEQQPGWISCLKA